MKIFPPLANLFAFGSENPARLAEVERRVRASGRYAQVWRPHPRWVAASAPLHGSVEDDAGLRGRGFAFAEGRDAMLGDSSTQSEQCRSLAQSLEGGGDLGRWPGDFSFFFFHPDGAATAVRSCAGSAPVYYAQGADGVALATQCDALIRFAGLGTGLDPLTAAVWTMGFPSFLSNRTHLAGMRGLMPGEMVKIQKSGGHGPPYGEDVGRAVPVGFSPDKAEVRRHWMPLRGEMRRPSAAQVDEHQQRLRAYLLKRLGEDLDPDGQNLLTLSGGVDSSALLALAGGGLKLPVMTWSLVPPASAPTQKRELGYIEPLRQWAGVTRHWQKEVTEDVAEDLIPHAPDIPFVVLHPALCSLGEITRQAEVKVMVGGEFADEICGGRLSTPDWAAGTTLWELMTSFRRWPIGRSAPARWLKGRALNALDRPYFAHPDGLPAFCPPGLQAEYREFLEGLRRWVNSLPVQHRYLFTRQQTIDFTPQNWEACSFYGIRRSIPFLSREMIELTLECHPSELIGPDTKRLLRGALHNDVPHHNLYRGDKGDFGLRFTGVKRPIADLQLDDEALWGELAAIVSPQWRRAAVKQGWIGFGEKYPLLYLKTLQKNLKSAVKAAM